MMSLEQIRKALADRNLREIHRQTGIHYWTLSRIKNGQSANPTLKTMTVLSEYLRGTVE